MNGLSSKGEWSENLEKDVSGLIPLKKLVYLISPNKINKNFIKLRSVLSYGNVKFFQLRLKKLK